MLGELIGFGNQITFFHDARVRSVEVNVKSGARGFAQSRNEFLDSIIGIAPVHRAGDDKQRGLKALLPRRSEQHGNKIINPHSKQRFKQAHGIRYKKRSTSRFELTNEEVLDLALDAFVPRPCPRPVDIDVVRADYIVIGSIYRRRSLH